jgi:hypothetical protein
MHNNHLIKCSGATILAAIRAFKKAVSIGKAFFRKKNLSAAQFFICFEVITQ